MGATSLFPVFHVTRTYVLILEGTTVYKYYIYFSGLALVKGNLALINIHTINK